MANATRKGFTLPEVLVTIAIVATLAAVLLPALNSQLAKGEAARVTNDLLAVETAANTFVSDVRRYPGQLVHLTTQITNIQQDGKASPTVYPQALVTKWKGPYLNKVPNANFDVPTGYGSFIKNQFRSVSYPGVNYLAVDMTPFVIDDFNRIDEIIDESISTTGGRLRFDAAGSGTATYLALPLQ